MIRGAQYAHGMWYVPTQNPSPGSALAAAAAAEEAEVSAVGALGTRRHATIVFARRMDSCHSSTSSAMRLGRGLRGLGKRTPNPLPKL